VELPGETIGLESYVSVAGDSEGEELVSPVLKRASDAYGEYRVGLTQAKFSRSVGVVDELRGSLRSCIHGDVIMSPVCQFY
jgi:hypothetical protein